MHANALFATVIALIFAAGNLAQSAAAAAGALSIKRQQQPSGLSLTTPPPDIAAPDEARQSAQQVERALLTFQAYGRTFRLELEFNERLLQNFGAAEQARIAARIKPYRGRLAGNAQSWARINQIGDKLSGMIWDGKEIFIIDPPEEIASALSAPAAHDPRRPLIYRLRDATLNAKCALDPTGQSLIDYDALIKELRGRARALARDNTALARDNTAQSQDEIALPATATKEISLAVVADALFVQANGSDPQAAVVARMNVVDGIYSAQVGVHLKLTSVLPLSSNGTLTATAPSTLLSQFGNYSANGGFNNPGLGHLFTGRNLDGSTIGIAYLGALCSKRYGVGVSQINGTGTAGALIVAHEIGHNFGAPHDNQSGSPCASTPGSFIMNPSINGSNTFSSCSLSQMAPEISGAACITTGGGGGGGTASLSATPSSLRSGSALTAAWSGIAAPTSTDWIGLFRSGAAAQSYIDWMYVSCGKAPSTARASGSCAFTVPSSAAAGTYELRLHSANGFSVIAKSGAITVTSGSVSNTPTLSATPTSVAAGASVTASWNAIPTPTPTDWIGLHVPGAASTSFIDWIYVSCSKTAGTARASGSCAFRIPATVAAGTYQLRLHSANGFSVIATSPNIGVTR